MSEPNKTRNIYLTGMMGSGKTTIGQLVAQKLYYIFIDTDAIIERRMSMSVAEIFETRGESSFREQERLLLPEIAAREHQVIATGGGMLVDPENMDVASSSGLVVLLHAPASVLADRLSLDSERPLLQDGDLESRLTEIWRQREVIYQAIAHKIDTSHEAMEANADNVITVYLDWLST